MGDQGNNGGEKPLSEFVKKGVEHFGTGYVKEQVVKQIAGEAVSKPFGFLSDLFSFQPLGDPEKDTIHETITLTEGQVKRNMELTRKLQYELNDNPNETYIPPRKTNSSMKNK